MAALLAVSLCAALVAVDGANDLRPNRPFRLEASQVAAVMCIGDSWMTGFNVDPKAASNIKQPFADYRGGSWGCGDGIISASRTVETLGTLLRRFNPKLEGLSRGIHDYDRIDPCTARRHLCGLNAAIDGASLIHGRGPDGLDSHLNSSLLRQAMDLRRWIDAERPQLLAQWKVLTLMPSWGDQWWSLRSVPFLRGCLRELFHYMRSHLPMTYVNLIAVSEHPSTIDEMLARDPWCQLRVTIWKAQAFLLQQTAFNTNAGADAYALRINDELREVAKLFDDGKRFIVRFRPVMLGFTFQRRLMERSTCFHPNALLVESLAFGVLQNMLTRSPAKQLRRLPTFDVGPEARPVDSASVLTQRWRLYDAFRQAVLSIGTVNDNDTVNGTAGMSPSVVGNSAVGGILY